MLYKTRAPEPELHSWKPRAPELEPCSWKDELRNCVILTTAPPCLHECVVQVLQRTNRMSSWMKTLERYLELAKNVPSLFQQIPECNGDISSMAAGCNAQDISERAQPASVLKIKQKYTDVSACQRPAFIRARNRTQQYSPFVQNKRSK